VTVMHLIDRYRGSLLGLAVGDALGTVLEFEPPELVVPIDDMLGGGPFDLEPGQWTDDTSMALCLAESLITCGDFDPVDQLQRYVRWYRQGHLSSTGRCFDIGGTTRAALHRFEQTGRPDCGSTDPQSAGNGSLTRLAPVPLFYARHRRLAVTRSADSSRTTHAAREAVDACRYFAALLVGILGGSGKAELLAEPFHPVPGLWDEDPLTPAVAEVASGSFKRRQPPEIRGSGHVVRCLEAALWAFHSTDSFRDGALLAVNLGDDADTTGAVFGQLTGAYYGVDDIPQSWRSRLAFRELIESYADQLYRLSRVVAPGEGEA
jgi:ADP-ribosyl-[dinitrogen reductase] hydrolase